jgi:hypothetical protein
MGIREWLTGQPSEPVLAEVTGVMLEGDELVAAVGEASYQDPLRRICGSTRWEDVRCEVLAALVPEPTNEYDPNAVAVQVDGERVGYLSRGDALDYGPAVQEFAARGKVIVCNARICGRGPGSDTANLGIFLHMPDPDAALAEADGA